MKICTKCRLLQDYSCFNRQKRNSDGFTSWCKKCIRKQEASHNYLPQYNVVKKCQKCGEEKVGNDFYKDKTNPDGLENRCKQCCIKRKDDNCRRKKYGITLEEYERILQEQKCKCAICGTIRPGAIIKRFHIDHCHKSNKVRGLLCENCNRAIGQLQDDPTILRKAAEYLERE